MFSVRAVQRAAREARHKGVEALCRVGFEDEQYAHTVFSETLQHLNQMTYQDRAVELLRPVHAIVSSLFGPDLSKWVEMVKKVRNQQSHQWVEDFDESSIVIYYVVVESCRWALVLRILFELEPEYDFPARLARSDRFSFNLANIDREELWPRFSALLTEVRCCAPTDLFTDDPWHKVGFGDGVNEVLHLVPLCHRRIQPTPSAFVVVRFSDVAR